MSKFPVTNTVGMEPEGDSPSHIRNSERVGHGHNDNPHRMPHPFRDGFEPNDESGRGKDNHPQNRSL